MKKYFIAILILLAACPAISLAQKKTTTTVRQEQLYYTSTREVPKIIWYHGEVNIGYGVGNDYEAWVSNNGHWSDRTKVSTISHHIQLETIQGIHITQYASVGIGIQFQHIWAADRRDQDLLPIYLDLKGYLPIEKRKPLTPYILADIGFEPLDVGIYIAGGIGANFGKRWNVALGCQYFGGGRGLNYIHGASGFIKGGISF